ncbi:Tpr-related protein family member, putative [Theileria annulata]|uniref:Tpr-related protein family member, putative n=1 Tax=Theileria annulata TaxID=5874 RepID=Q4UFU2_THEAN|nr:Tpr-related protein family member, putative [Theileria annulata]CAI74216.1 Tpr-related protein family member, putative [Theileria annulata]|eukprot:XP_951948.1 Tpr-related protein family member, putative [Theileria annulata]
MFWCNVWHSRTLYDKANTLSTTGPNELSTQANALKEAASQPSDKSCLKEKAGELAKTTTDESKAKDVIEKFEAVRTAYDLLMAAATSHKTNPAVKAVITADADLKKHYDTILNVTKATTLKGEADTIKGEAGTLHTNSTSLATAVQGNSATSDEALKQKAGNESTKGTLRNLAKELYTKAQALATAVKSGDGNKAQDLANAVSSDEEKGIRKELKALADAQPDELTDKASAVKQQYNEVKEKFAEVKKQESKYAGSAKPKYDKVVAAWDAFNKVYDADLKGLASTLATADLITRAQDVIDKFNSVDAAYKAVNALATTYKVFASSQYPGVDSKFQDLQTKFNQISKLVLFLMDSRIKTSEIKSKASALSSNADTQSTIELASTQNTDLNEGNNTAQDELPGKATQLKTNAETLSGVAQQLATAGSPLSPLNETAGALKTAAGTEGSGGGLAKKAEDLATKAGSDASSQADKVIEAFENVEAKYLALMKQAKQSEITNDPAVIEVVKAYHAVKTTYYQMLIGYRFRYLIGDGLSDNKILHKASDLHTKASNLAGATGLRDETHKELRDLAEKLRDAVGNTGQGLQLALSALKSANTDALIVEKALAVIEKYNAVKEAYDKVKAREKDYNKHAAGQYTLVKSAFTQLEEKFETLKKSYENVLRLRVQELATLAQALSGKASALPGAVGELQNEARALASAASKDTGKSGLKEKAEALRDAINSGTGAVGTQATEVIKQFEDVAEKYNDLKKAANDNNKQDEPVVKEVDGAYTNLKKVYDPILNFTKIKYYSNEVETRARQITSSGTPPSEVKPLIDKLKSVYS